MLKMFLSFISAIIIMTCIFSCKTHALTSAQKVLITGIQAGAVGGATQEFVTIYNNSADEIDVSGWCLTNKNNVSFGCLSTAIGYVRYLPAYSYATIVSASYASVFQSANYSTIYTPLSLSSGSIIGGADTISLLNKSGIAIDSYSWTTAIASGSQFLRRSSGSPLQYQDTDLASDWSVVTSLPIPADMAVLEKVLVDICPNIDGYQELIPDGYYTDTASNCVKSVTARLDITEVFPNAVGSDTGQEFVELYNPNDAVIDLADYTLLVGPELLGVYSFPKGSTIEPGGYKTFSNNDISYTLLNSSSRVAISLKSGIIVGQAPSYVNPGEGMSWSLLGDTWAYTNHPTPSAANVRSDTLIETEVTPDVKPCASNQYRNPETGRCRLTNSTTVFLTPCKDGQYRSEQTNRCRSIAADAKEPAPCPAGQLRSTETNRCRKIAVATVPAACKPGQQRNTETNRCRTVVKMTQAGFAVTRTKPDISRTLYIIAAVGVVVLLGIGYAVWEWRQEVGRLLMKLGRATHLNRFMHFRRFRK